MQIVIDITEDIYEDVKKTIISDEIFDEIVEAFRHGTPLPDGAEILTKEAYSDLCTRAADVPDFESDEYVEKRIENYNNMLKSGILDCLKEESDDKEDIPMEYFESGGI